MSFDPWSFRTMYSKHWGWLYILLALIPFLMVLAITFYVLSLLVTDEDLYYKDVGYTNEYKYSTLSEEFSKMELVAEIVPHAILGDDDDRYLPFQFKNNTYFRDQTFDDGESPKKVRYEELFYIAVDKKSNLPHLMFKKEYVPFGDSKYLWLNIKYKPRHSGSIPYKEYTQVQKLPACFGYKQEIWNPDDPVNGVNLLAWKEFGNVHEGKCDNGIVKNDICFEYALMSEIWVIIHPTNDDPTQGWYLKDGCFEGGSAIKYIQARPGIEYKFENIPIQVWAHKGAFYEFESKEQEFGADLSYFGWLSRMWWVLWLCSFIAFVIAGWYRFNLPNDKEL